MASLREMHAEVEAALDATRFRLWLEDRDGGYAGTARLGGSCPLATYLDEIAPSLEGTTEVGDEEVTADTRDAHMSLPLPRWGREFVRLVDMQPADYTRMNDGLGEHDLVGDECLPLLDEAVQIEQDYGEDGDPDAEEDEDEDEEEDWEED